MLQNGTLSWYSQQGIAGVHLLPGLTYDEHRQELVVAKAGSYIVCLRLALSRVLLTSQDSGRVSLALRLQPPQAGATAQALAVELTPDSSVSVEDSRCHLLQMSDNQRLSVRLRVYLSAEVGEHQAWQLDHPATELELFRVAAEVPD
ncbi:PREDICTED: tumor necrosis factor ligand superfamily member 9 [Chinchilla lanigera]|uniref:tumor necrosis factor ligand superfamily member 9 n=1 Tax=Chinchilla lanigera TaxID=34839 RepID=UPI00038F0308|nr:PREDICTED: tumor necrosis factor ligand superfamily member 9 [Chinchilla lanigera]